MNTNEKKPLTSLNELIEATKLEDVDKIAPKFRKKNTMSDEQLEKIVQIIALNLDIDPKTALIGMILLFLQGAASAGTPPTMSVEIGNIVMEKRHIMNACFNVTGHQFIRRIAESMAETIGLFAYKNHLAGELAYRINNKLKAENGTSLTEMEMAFCSSFSQAIPNLENKSERLAKLLAEDYQKRFENKKKSDKSINNNSIKAKKTKGKGRRR